MSVESYLHKYAKTVMASWLRKLTGRNFRGLNNIGITLKNKPTGPMFGVYTEYPVCQDTQSKSLIGIDESWEHWLSNNNVTAKAKHGIPTRWELKEWKDKCKMIHIFDIVVLDNTQIAYAFEICHKHPIEDPKIEFVKQHEIPCYEVAAQWIMEKCKLPANLETLRNFP